MKIEDFKKLPNIEGFTIGKLRIDNIAEYDVVGYVLNDKEGVSRYILYFGEDFKIEPYW